MIMDEIFGTTNFVATIVWQKVYSRKNSERLFQKIMIISLFMRNMRSTWKPNLIPRKRTNRIQPIRTQTTIRRGPWKTGDLSARNYTAERHI